MMTKRIFDEETDSDVLALVELSPELHDVVEALLEHVNDGYDVPLCGAQIFERDLLVDAALASDCERCRTQRGVEDFKGQRPVKVWEPQPLDGADTMLDEKQKRSDGR